MKGRFPSIWQRFLAWLLPFPDVDVTLSPFSMPFNTRVLYYHTGLGPEMDIIRIHTVELNLFIPGDLVPDDEIIDVTSLGSGAESQTVNLVDFVLYGLKWESTVQAVTRCMGLSVAMDLDKWVMDGDYKTLTGEVFPFFAVPKVMA